MSGLLMLKQLYNLSDEAVTQQWRMNPNFQSFCGMSSFQTTTPCHPTELVKFRNRIGKEGVEQIFGLSVKLHGPMSEEAKVLVDTTVQEKMITYPTDFKLAIKIINRLNKLAKGHGIKQRRTYVKEVKALRLASRHFRHVKVRAKA
jgi:IS5 family transposase